MAFKPVERDPDPKPCITLVGMAGAGKSTLGQALAEHLGWEQLDTDRLMEAYYGLSLQSIMDTFGLDEFLRIESYLVSELGLKRTVISTGGSVIYSDRAVARLKELGAIVFLDIDEATFIERVGSAEDRGLAIAPGTTMVDLYNERQPLYRKAADVTVRTDSQSVDACVNEIIKQVQL